MLAICFTIPRYLNSVHVAVKRKTKSLISFQLASHALTAVRYEMADDSSVFEPHQLSLPLTFING